MTNAFRRLLIQMGKVLPFLLCLLLLVEYTETLISTLFGMFGNYGDCVIAYSGIALFVGQYFEYDWMTVVPMFILSVAINTCAWNKLVVIYLAAHLVFKAYSSDTYFSPEGACVACMVNCAICAFFCYKAYEISVNAS